MTRGRPAAPAPRPGVRRPPAPARSGGQPVAKAPLKPPVKPTRTAGKPVPKAPSRKPARPLAKSALTPPEPRAPAPRGWARGSVRDSVRDSVSATSARRFSARVRARHRHQLLIALALVAVLAGGGWFALKSPWATVEHVTITGTDRIPVADIRALAGTEVGHPLLTARTGDVRARIAALRLVRSVQVTRHFPAGLRIVVTEREPVAAVPDGRGRRVALVDPDGVVVERDASAPSSLPLIQVAAGPADAASIRGCLAVLHGLPATLAGRLKSIGASSADGIHLTLKNGATVQWGSGDRTALKAKVLLALLPQHASRYDVRSPDTPSVGAK